MPWLQIHFAVNDTDARRIEPLLEDSGACAVTLTDAADQPLLEPLPGETPIWDETVASALYAADADLQAILVQLAADWRAPLPPFKVEQLADQDWERAWIDDFSPMQFGQALWIVPSWCEPPDPSAINLRLDPGLAFGTGTHETTALCLEWLDAHHPRGQTVLDYGCGSGVLALAALLCGAHHVTGCDIDPQALDATTRNAGTNGQADRIRTCLPETMPAPAAQFDLVMANILAGPLQSLAPTLAGFCRPGGELVLSGILAAQADDVAAAYAPFFTMAPAVQRGDWIRLSGTRKA